MKKSSQTPQAWSEQPESRSARRVEPDPQSGQMAPAVPSDAAANSGATLAVALGTARDFEADMR